MNALMHPQTAQGSPGRSAAEDAEPLGGMNTVLCQSFGFSASHHPRSPEKLRCWRLATPTQGLDHDQHHVSIDLRSHTALDAEPRVQDLRLAQSLGFARPRDIRKIIGRNREELERYGAICTAVAQNTGRGRPATAYWLTEGQALCLAALSNAPRACHGPVLQGLRLWRVS